MPANLRGRTRGSADHEVRGQPSEVPIVIVRWDSSPADISGGCDIYDATTRAFGDDIRELIAVVRTSGDASDAELVGMEMLAELLAAISGLAKNDHEQIVRRYFRTS
jgi:hypothetical protein